MTPNFLTIFLILVLINKLLSFSLPISTPFTVRRIGYNHASKHLNSPYSLPKIHINICKSIYEISCTGDDTNAPSPTPHDVDINTPEKYSPTTSISTNKKLSLKEQVVAKGQGALLAYGFLNVCYYLSLTAIAWYATSSKVSNQAAAQLSTNAIATLSIKTKLIQAFLRISKLSTIVWAGSQVFNQSCSFVAPN
jgi:hypothetical protein